MDENIEKVTEQQPQETPKPEESTPATNSPNIAETLVKNGLTKEELEGVLKDMFPKPKENVEQTVNNYISSLRKMI